MLLGNLQAIETFIQKPCVKDSSSKVKKEITAWSPSLAGSRFLLTTLPSSNLLSLPRSLHTELSTHQENPKLPPPFRRFSFESLYFKGANWVLLPPYPHPRLQKSLYKQRQACFSLPYVDDPSSLFHSFSLLEKHLPSTQLSHFQEAMHLFFSKIDFHSFRQAKRPLVLRLTRHFKSPGLASSLGKALQDFSLLHPKALAQPNLSELSFSPSQISRYKPDLLILIAQAPQVDAFCKHRAFSSLEAIKHGHCYRLDDSLSAPSDPFLALTYFRLAQIMDDFS